MIIKNFDIKRLKSHKSSIYLFYGDNEGNKEKTVKNIFLDKFTGTIEKYDEKEVLNDLNNIISGFLNKSFFDDKKIVIVSRVSEKIVDFVNEILDRKIEDVKIILKSGTLEKRSKLRNLFEKENIDCKQNYKLFCDESLFDNYEIYMTNNIDIKKVENINACKDLYEKDYQYQSTAIKLTNTPFINLFYFSLSILVMAINEIKFNFNNKKRKIN